jgi:virginiamycin B lyase
MVKQPDSSERISRRGVRFAALVLTGILAGLAAEARGQAFTEFPIPTADSRPSGITDGPGGLWFTEANANNIARITTAGVISEFPIPTGGSYPQGITTGFYGDLWFTESLGNKIGRITTQANGIVTASSITEFEIPTANSHPFGIVAGPDGNLWFTESHKIGRITPDGVITEFPLRVGNTATGGIATDYDNLWFTETAVFGLSVVGLIGRITPAGVITEFDIPGSLRDPIGIVAKTRFELWFTEANANKIGQITDKGVVTEFPLPSAGSSPQGIAVGSDGNLWFTEVTAGRIGQITTTGVVAEFIVPTAASSPFGISAGPDHNLWFTEADGNKIGRINLSAARCSRSDTNLCLNSARFKVEATWTTPDGATGSGHAVALTPGSGYFWFFSPNKAELVVKAIDACSFNNRSWLFAAGLTNVNVALKITDTRSNQVKIYTNPQGAAFQPIQDTSAFPCQ